MKVKICLIGLATLTLLVAGCATTSGVMEAEGDTRISFLQGLRLCVEDPQVQPPLHMRRRRSFAPLREVELFWSMQENEIYTKAQAVRLGIPAGVALVPQHLLQVAL